MKRIVHSFSWDNRESQAVFWRYQKDMTEQAIAEVSYFLKLLNTDSFYASKILDVGCGVGYHAKVLSDLGASVTGIDVSDYCLNIARERCEGSNTEFFLVKAINTKWDEVFDFAIAIRHTLGFMPHEEIVEHFRRIKKSLKPFGKVLLTVPFSLEKGRTQYPVHKWSDENGVFTLVDKYIEEDNYKIERCVIIDTEKDIVEEYHERQRFYSTAETVEILNSAGFSSVETLKNIQGEEVDSQGGAQVYVATK